ncbi:MAG: SDR family NAD(P)-dependent oxidoreductase [Deltaproteobacteria bacterium]|nr:SDR family NAD(P)-dependent oxidoreductase [Deltaproteobacteria bacterium]
MGLLGGKVAIVTGAGGAIGRATALLLARHGASVVAGDLGTAPDGTGSSPEPARGVAGEIEQAGGAAVACCADVSREEGAAAVVRAAVERFGRLDALVTCAGIARRAPLLELGRAAWEAVLGVELAGTFLCLQRAAAQMVAQGEGGRIVCTTGMAGLRGAGGEAAAAAAEAGIYGLVRAAAIELEPHRITVNAVCAVAKTRLTEDLTTFLGMDALSPEHVAPAALFLASGLCGERSGQVLGAAGGRMSLYQLVESRGQHKDRAEIWTAEEIAEYWAAIAKPWGGTGGM